jgi:hypothetical protein
MKGRYSVAYIHSPDETELVKNSIIYNELTPIPSWEERGAKESNIPSY